MRKKKLKKILWEMCLAVMVFLLCAGLLLGIARNYREIQMTFKTLHYSIQGYPQGEVLLMGSSYMIFRVSVLERRDYRKEELDFLSRNAKTGQIVFLGDSITHYCPVEEFYGECGLRVYNRGIASETSEDARKRLDGNVLVLRPSKLVILLGCNDIGEKITAEQTVNNIKEIIKRAREKCPGIGIILQADWGRC